MEGIAKVDLKVQLFGKTYTKSVALDVGLGGHSFYDGFNEHYENFLDEIDDAIEAKFELINELKS